MVFICYVPYCDTNRLRLREYARKKRERNAHIERIKLEAQKNGYPIEVTSNLIKLVHDSMKSKISDDTISIHSIPKGKFDLWDRIMPKKMNAKFTPKSRVCSKHFRKEDFFPNTLQIQGKPVPVHKRTLKSTSIPTIFPKEIPKYLLKNVKTRKPPRDRSAPLPPKKKRVKPLPPVLPEVGAEIEISVEDADLGTALNETDLGNCTPPESPPPSEDDNDIVTLEFDDSYSSSGSEGDDMLFEDAVEDDDLPQARHLTYSSIVDFVKEIRLPTTLWNCYFDSEKVTISHLNLSGQIPILDKSLLFEGNKPGILLVRGKVKASNLLFANVDELNNYILETEKKKCCAGSKDVDESGLPKFHDKCLLLISNYVEDSMCLFCSCQPLLSTKI